MSGPGDITPEMLEAMPDEYRHELLLLLQVLDRPKLARICPQPASPSEPQHLDLRGAIEAGNKLVLARMAMSPEERAVLEAQETKNEIALLDWYNNRGGKDQELHPLVAANVRLAKHKYEPLPDNSPTPRQEYDALAAKAAKPVELEVPQEQNEVLKPLVIATEERKPTSIMEALNRSTRESMQIGESFGSWRR